MLKRTITGGFLVAVLVGFFFLRRLDSAFFHIAISLIAVIGTVEAVKMTGEKTAPAQKITCVLSAIAISALFYFFNATGALVTLAIFLIVQFFIPVFSRAKYNMESLTLSLFAIRRAG